MCSENNLLNSLSSTLLIMNIFVDIFFSENAFSHFKQKIFCIWHSNITKVLSINFAPMTFGFIIWISHFICCNFTYFEFTYSIIGWDWSECIHQNKFNMSKCSELMSFKLKYISNFCLNIVFIMLVVPNFCHCLFMTTLYWRICRIRKVIFAISSIFLTYLLRSKM